FPVHYAHAFPDAEEDQMLFSDEEPLPQGSPPGPARSRRASRSATPVQQEQYWQVAAQAAAAQPVQPLRPASPALRQSQQGQQPPSLDVRSSFGALRPLSADMERRSYERKRQDSCSIGGQMVYVQPPVQQQQPPAFVSPARRTSFHQQFGHG